MRARGVNELLRYAALSHLVLDERERGLVLANVVGHVAVAVHSQQVGSSLCNTPTLERKEIINAHMIFLKT